MNRPTSSRDAILAAVRAQARPATELPDLTGPWIVFEDRLAQFASVLQVVGARCHRAADAAAANELFASIPEIAAAKQIVSLVPGVGQANIDLAVIDDPHQLETVDVAVLPGAFGVAENGAIWVTSAGVRHRAIYVIVQHLVLVIPASEIVDTMHDAYARIDPAQTDWGAFISGPSKTADIEQSLVVGAHGPRSLDVICLG
jgi:L-lactate dehydrogenase complex protein LldG